MSYFMEKSTIIKVDFPKGAYCPSVNLLFFLNEFGYDTERHRDRGGIEDQNEVGRLQKETGREDGICCR